LFAGVLPPERIHLVPNFAQDYLFLAPAEIDAKFAVSPPLRVLFLSNLIPGKGYRELLEAFLSLDPVRQMGLRIDFAGGFSDEIEQAEFLERIRPYHQLGYHGIVGGDPKRHLLQDAHVLCLPTYYPYEGQPISILEAYAAGCAVITTDHSGIGDVFRDGENGFQVAKRSVGDLAGALARAAADPEALRAMAHTNRDMAQLHYRTRIYNERLTRIIEGVSRDLSPVPNTLEPPARAD
jgi:glycosyltransferase involved in cell wall biosynthesis